MAYIEILQDGVTIGQAVRRAGDVVNAPDFEPMKKSEQVERWGEPRFKEITEKEFKERGGGQEAVAVEFQAPAPPAGGGPAGAATEFADLDGLNVNATLDRVAEFDDEKTARFIEFEKANQDRKGVLGPLGVDTD